MFIFLAAACSATDLASLAAEATYKSSRGQTTVTSQTRDYYYYIIIIIIIIIIINIINRRKIEK